MLVHQDDIASVLALLAKQGTLSIDTETTGLERRDKPFAAIIATDTDEYYFDERCSGKFWDKLNDIGPKDWALQNAKFDMKMLNRMGVVLQGRHFDTACGSRIKRNDHMLHSLDAQAQRELGVPKSDAIKKYIKEHDLFETRKDFFGVEYKSPKYQDVPLEIMHNYACLDARLTYDLHKKYSTELAMPQHRLYEMEAMLTPVCYRMEEHGLLLDKEYTLAAMYREQSLSWELKEKYKAITGTAFVNSAKSVQKVIQAQLPLTEDGNPSLTDDVIELLLNTATTYDRGIVELVRGIRTYEKRISTYYKSYLNFMTGQSIIHPTMWQAGTRTGRFSYSDPNLQNIPKEEHSEHEHVVRGCFIPRPGRKFVSFDYSQMEYRMMAAYANETEIIAAVMGGADFHQATASLLGITRSEAKTLNFALLYGAGEDKIAAMLGVAIQQAKILKFKYFAKLPKVERLIDQVINTGKSRGYVETWCKRRMYAAKEFCYALPNHLIQGGGADVVKLAMIEIARSFPEIPMVVQIHDQLVFEMTDKDMQHIPEIKGIMEGIFTAMNGMVLKVDVSVSSGSLAEKDMVKLG